jgi:hypothetical protein
MSDRSYGAAREVPAREGGSEGAQFEVRGRRYLARIPGTIRLP